ncbi:MAG: putative manganese-dependent inorganic diphosphatase [Bacillota bacterium]|nr:putative manganese-dependent inorganic diphosphatase [Bacillota bacterium]
MKDVIYVTGHKNPDSDSICAAVAYAELKNKIGTVPAVPIRLGEISRETNFILDYFGVEAPHLVETLKARVADLTYDAVSTISPEISLKMAWQIMKKNNLTTLPVTDEKGALVGLTSISNLTSSYMDIWDNNILSKSNTTIENILDTLSAKIIYQSKENPAFPGKIVVAAMQPSSAEQHIEEGDIVICGDRKDAQAIILEAGASLMIVAGSHTVDDEIANKAKEVGCTIISTPHDTFTAARLIVQSIPVSYVMTKDNLISFSNQDHVEDVKAVMQKTRFRQYPVIDKNGKVLGSVSRFHLISQNKKKVVLVDHNERTQSVDGLEDAEVMEIIDHHRIAAVQTGNPIFFRNEPVGSTSTIVASMFFENGIRPSKKIAGILCGAIISDTLLFRSPTSTDTDKMILKRLAEIAGIDPEAFATEMFKAGTSLTGRTITEIFNQDYKVFNIDEYKVGVSQVGTMDIEGFEPMKAEMISFMQEKAEKENFNLILLLLTDIIKGGSQIIAVGKNKEIVNKAFNVTLTGDDIYVPGVLSRKKQVIPPLTAAIESLKE